MKKEMNEPIHWFEKHYKKYGNYKVAAEFSKFHWKYFQFKSKEFWDYWKNIEQFQPNHRYIFADELILEGDLPDRKVNYKNTLKIDKMLEAKQISHLKFYSGNKSYHYHLYFPELLLLKTSELRTHKQKILSWIFDCHKLWCKHSSCKVKDWGIDTQLVGGKHLIRSEYGFHNKTARKKILLAERNYGTNYIPKEITEAIELRKKELAGMIKLPRIAKLTDPCVGFFLKDLKEDVRKRALFFLVHRFAGARLNKMEAHNKLIQWNERLNDYFLERTIELELNRAYDSTSKMRPGCNFAKSLLNEIGEGDICNKCPNNYHGNKSKGKPYSKKRKN